MGASCPAPTPEEPLVQSLLGVVDCNVRDLVHLGYGAIFQPGGPLFSLLTALLTVYIAMIGYRLMLGQGQLRISEFVLNAVKVGAVLALATQWGAYQVAVYDLLFRGPQQVADMIILAVQPEGALGQGGIYGGLQSAFDDLSRFGAGYAAHTAAISPLLGGAGLAAFLLTASACVLLLSSLGLLLAAKIVLGLLLALGPVFIALSLFESTRGVFAGWLRASLAFAFVPLAVTVLLAIALTMLDPLLIQMDQLQRQQIYTPGAAFSIITLILVFAGASFGAVIAGAMIAVSFHLPRARRPQSIDVDSPTVLRLEPIMQNQSRAGRIAAAAAQMERRDTTLLVSESRSTDRRLSVSTTPGRDGRETVSDVRLGQSSSQRRITGPRAMRASARHIR